MVTIKIKKDDLDFIKYSSRVTNPFKQVTVNLLDNNSISIKQDPNGNCRCRIISKESMPIDFTESNTGEIELIGAHTVEKDRYVRLCMMFVNAVFNHIIEYQHQDISIATHKGSKRGNGKKSKNGTNYTIYLKRFDRPDTVQHRASASNEPDHQFDVRGYYRRCKSGKRVWVRPYTKYKDKPTLKEAKTFKLDFQ